jgi:hypothetical protein
MEASRETTLLARLEELSRDLNELRRRVVLLERGPSASTAELETQPPLPQLAPPPSPELELMPEVGLEWAAGLVPLFGWGLLGIAGASASGWASSTPRGGFFWPRIAPTSGRCSASFTA